MINIAKSCLVDKFIPKKTFYEKVSVSSNIKQEFVDKVEKIIWKYKISEDNVNIAKTDNVEEIEVFELILKEKYEVKNIIKVITKEIPYQILFCIKYNDEFQYAIKYNEDIFFSEWNKLVTYCFTGLNLEAVYDNIVKEIMEIDKNDADLDYEIQKKKEIERLTKEIQTLENKMRMEKQFNRKVEINKVVLDLKQKRRDIENNG